MGMATSIIIYFCWSTSVLFDFHACFQEQIVYKRWGLPVLNTTDSASLAVFQ